MHECSTTYDPPGTMPCDRRPRLLVVDDEPLLRGFYTQALQGRGHEVVTAAEGQTALDLYAKALRQNRPFDLVLMDMRMPGLDGKACAKALLAMDDGARVMMISGNGDLDLGPFAERLSGIIAKPVGLTELLRAVHDILAGQEARPPASTGLAG